jgi:PAS domain S-box-containing protein
MPKDDLLSLREDLKQTKEALRQSELRFELAALAVRDGIWEWNFPSNRMYYSTRWKSMLGYSENEIGTTSEEWFGRIHQEDLELCRAEINLLISGDSPSFEREHRLRHKDGHYIWVLGQFIPAKDDSGKIKSTEARR